MLATTSSAFGTLNGELRPLVADIGDGAVELRGFALHVRNVIVAPCGVDADEKARRALAVDDEVIDDAAVLDAHHGVERFAVGQLADVVGDDPLQGVLGLGPFDDHLAHVRDIKDPDPCAHGVMLGDQTSELHRHFPTGKGHKPRTQRSLHSVKWRPT